MNTITRALAASSMLAATVAFAGDVERLALTGSYDTQGCPLPGAASEPTYTAGGEYVRDRDGFELHARIRNAPQGADCTKQGQSTDIGADKRYDLTERAVLSGSFGYRSNGVTGFAGDGTEVVFGRAVQTTFATNVGFRLNDGLLVEGGLNLADTESCGGPCPRIALDYERTSERFGEFSVESSLTWSENSHSEAKGRVHSFRAAWQRTFVGSLGLELSHTRTYGYQYLPDPFSGRANAPAANHNVVTALALTVEM